MIDFNAINNFITRALIKCYASTFVKDIRESYAIKKICRRL